MSNASSSLKSVYNGKVLHSKDKNSCQIYKDKEWNREDIKPYSSLSYVLYGNPVPLWEQPFTIELAIIDIDDHIH